MNHAEARKFADAWDKHRAAGGLMQAFVAGFPGVHKATVYHWRQKAERVLGRKLAPMNGSKAQQARDAAKAERERGINSKLFHAEQPASPDRTFEEVLADRLKSTKRRMAAKDSAELLKVRVNIAGPFGIAFIGDPHVDNPGCNLELLLKHTEIVRNTDGLFAMCVGDVQDSWIGRLARLWASQGISSTDSLTLVNGWLEMLAEKLLALVEGNHDAWAHGINGQSPLEWIRTRYGALVQRNGARVQVTNLDGDQVIVNCRHDFPGRSQYNNAHGPTKSLMFGFRDDVAVAGHTHVFGRGAILDPATRKPMHAVRLGSYKHADEYAEEKGLLDQNLSECSVLIVDPLNPDRRHRTYVLDSPARAAQHLTMLRKEWAKRK